MLSSKAIESLLKDVYKTYAYTNNYIVGTYDTKTNTVYANILMDYELVNLANLDKSSRSLGHRLRYRQNKALKQLIESQAVKTFKLCSIDTIETVAHQLSNKQVNRGLAFEKLITEHYNQTWKHDIIPWYQGPDIIINDIPFQIKYDNCNFTNITQIFHFLGGL